MDDLLSQNEVDALLSAVSDGAIETEADGGEIEALAYDLANQERIIRGRLPTLDIIHDKFIKLLGNTLSSMLRRIVTVRTIHTELMKFSEFIRTLPLPACLNILRLTPLRGNALLVVDSKIIYALVDSFFGGSLVSGYKVEGRDFTTIEMRLVRKLIHVLSEDMASAWAPVYPIRVDYMRSEVNPQFAAIVSENDIVMQIQFQVEIESIQGRMMIVIPYLTLSPIKDKLAASFQGEQLEVEDLWITHFKKLIQSVPVTCSAEVGRTNILIRDLLDLEAGDVICLDNAVEQGAVLCVEGKSKFRGKPGKSKSNMAMVLGNRVSEKKPEPAGGIAV